MLLVVGGFVGGVFTSLGGSGLDICSFSILTLVFNVSERIATPTSIVLMAINSLIAFAWRWGWDLIEVECWYMWLACVPVVVVGAPLGSIQSSHWHRLVIAWLVISIDTLQLIGALVIVQPWTSEDTSLPLLLSLESLGLFLLGCVFFGGLAYYGQFLSKSYDFYPQEYREDQENEYAEVGCSGLTQNETDILENADRITFFSHNSSLTFNSKQNSSDISHKNSNSGRNRNSFIEIS